MKKQASSDPAVHRKARLADELRANLQRRKAQARSRRDGEADERPEGLAAGSGGARDDADEDIHRRDAEEQ